MTSHGRTWRLAQTPGPSTAALQINNGPDEKTAQMHDKSHFQLSTGFYHINDDMMNVLVEKNRKS